MAITLEEVNALTDEQITPELEAALLGKLEPRATTYLTNKGIVVKPKADYDLEVKNLADAAVTKAVGLEAADLFGTIDGLILDATGQSKPANMKTKEWVALLKEQGILPLKPDDKDKDKGKVDATTKALIDGLEKKNRDLETSITEKEKKAFQREVNQTIDLSLQNAPVPVDPAADAAAKKKQQQDGISDLRSLFSSLYEAKHDDAGKLYFVKRGTETALMNTDEARPMTPLEIIRTNHRLYLAPEGHQQKGGGTGGSGGNGGNDAGGLNSLTAIRKAASDAHPVYTKEWYKFIDDKKAEAKAAGVKLQ